MKHYLTKRKFNALKSNLGKENYIFFVNGNWYLRQIGIIVRSGLTVLTRTNMQVCRIKLTTKNTINFFSRSVFVTTHFFSMTKISGTDFRQMLLCRLRRDLWELIFVFDEISVVDGGPGHHGRTRCPEKRTWILNRVFDELIEAIELCYYEHTLKPHILSYPIWFN